MAKPLSIGDLLAYSELCCDMTRRTALARIHRETVTQWVGRRQFPPRRIVRFRKRDLSVVGVTEVVIARRATEKDTRRVRRAWLIAAIRAVKFERCNSADLEVAAAALGVRSREAPLLRDDVAALLAGDTTPEIHARLSEVVSGDVPAPAD